MAKDENFGANDLRLKRSWSMDDCVLQQPKEEKQTIGEKVKKTMTVLWDNGFFQRLFPQIKQ